MPQIHYLERRGSAIPSQHKTLHCAASSTTTQQNRQWATQRKHVQFYARTVGPPRSVMHAARQIRSRSLNHRHYISLAFWRVNALSTLHAHRHFHLSGQTLIISIRKARETVNYRVHYVRLHLCVCRLAVYGRQSTAGTHNNNNKKNVLLSAPLFVACDWSCSLLLSSPVVLCVDALKTHYPVCAAAVRQSPEPRGLSQCEENLSYMHT